MTRAINDTTSTCGSCIYWSHIPEADGVHPTPLGDCGWLSLPAWTGRYIPINSPTRMRADAGADCWQHTKHESTAPKMGPQADITDALLEDCDRLRHKNHVMADTLKRIKAWDMMDAASDGTYWRKEIDAALSFVPPEPASRAPENTAPKEGRVRCIHGRPIIPGLPCHECQDKGHPASTSEERVP